MDSGGRHETLIKGGHKRITSIIKCSEPIGDCIHIELRHVRTPSYGPNTYPAPGVLAAQIVQYLSLRHNAYLVGNDNLNQTLVTEIAGKGPFDVLLWIEEVHLTLRKQYSIYVINRRK